MELSGIEQAIPSYYPKLGVSLGDAVNLLTELCKGRCSEKAHKWFYYLFLDRRYFGCPNSIEAVVEALRAAWWVEEEDIEQEIYYQIYRLNLSPDSNIIEVLARCLRDYLVDDQRVFSRQTGWETLYETENCYNIELYADCDLGGVLDPDLFTGLAGQLSLQQRYLFYLAYTLDLSLDEVSVILMQSRNTVDRMVYLLKKDMEEAYACSHTRRSSKTRLN